MSLEKTFNQVIEQEDAGHETATVLVERTDGRIHPAQLTSEEDAYGRRWAWFTDEIDGQVKGKPLSLDSITDEHQAALANNLALSAERSPEQWQRTVRERGAATLDAVGVEPPDFNGNAISRDELAQIRLEQESPEDAHARKMFSFPDAAAETRYGTSLRKRTTVTEKSLVDAAFAYRYAQQDEVVKRLFNEHKGDAWREEDMSEVLRTDNELRIALGKHFLSRLDTMNGLPDRVRRNAENNKKNPAFPGFENPMSSREYSALLAISMLDGTFKKPNHDPIVKNQYHEVELGQHRYAAQMLLGIEGKV